jgi:hypothetical protein
MILEFYLQALENTEISSFMKIRPVDADVFHAGGRADGRTDRQDETNSLFLQFCKRD